MVVSVCAAIVAWFGHSSPVSAVAGYPEPPAAPAASAPAPAPAATPAAPAPAPPSTRPGSPVELEQRLAAMHFDVGPADGVYDEGTSHAAMAFQKVYDMPRTGRIDEALILKVAESPAPPAPIVPGGEPGRVEIDLQRQVLYLYENGGLTAILPVSTGNGERYCSGGCRNAITPTGAFRVYRQAQGWEIGPLGGLYNPQYFEGGFAIHGSQSVPAHPASHGCVRIPMGSAEWFPAHVAVGTPVYVA